MSARSLPVSNVEIFSISTILENLGFRQLAREHGLVTRRSRKIDPVVLVRCLCQFALVGGASHLALAMGLGASTRQLVSKQGVWKWFGPSLLATLMAVIVNAMQEVVSLPRAASGGLFRHFSAVLLQDSTSIRAPQTLVETFPGCTNQSGRLAVAKLDIIIDILNWGIRRIVIKRHTDPDQSEAPRVHAYIPKGALIIRDLGYFVLDSLAEITRQECFFLTRLRHRLSLYGPDGKRIDLPGLLRKRGRLDMEVLLGDKKRIPARLIAVRLPDEVAEKRRRNALANRDRRINYTDEYLMLLGWAITLTNVPAKMWTAKEATEAYAFRWQVETMFKTLKSVLKLDQNPKTHTERKPHKFEAIILARMLVAVTILMPRARKAFTKEETIQNRPQLSLQKLAMAAFVAATIAPESEDWMEENSDYFCKYDRRKRENAIQKLYAKTLS